LASASTTDLGTVPSHNVNITGTTTITSFGQSASTTFPIYKVVFAGALTITYNQTNCSTTGGCILTPGGLNIVTATNDTAELFYAGTGSSGAGNWQIVNYQRQTGQPIVASTPLCGFSGLVIANGSSQSTITESWNAAVLLNASNVPVYSGSQTVSINITTSGAGGLDTGSVAANTFYYLYGIYNGTTWNGLASLSATAPTLPSGYTYLCRAGATKTNGSSNLYGIRQLGNEAQYVVGGANLTALPTINIGTIGSSCGTATPTWASFTVQANSGAAAWVPLTAAVISLVAAGEYDEATSTNAYYAPDSSYGGPGSTTSTSVPPVSIPANANSTAFRFVLESTAIYACVASGTQGTNGAILMAFGWKDSVNAN
jgi:hypothetical protein